MRNYAVLRPKTDALKFFLIIALLAISASAQASEKKDAKNVISKPNLKVSGFLQVYSYGLLDGEGSRGRNTFRLRRGQVIVTASDGSRLSGRIEVDLDKSELNGVANNQSALQDIFLTYRLDESTSPLSVDVGKYKIPLGYNKMISSKKLPLMERSMISSEGDYGGNHKMGFQLRGNTSKIEYYFGAFNGLEKGQNGVSFHGFNALSGLIQWDATNNTKIGVSAAQDRSGGRIFDTYVTYTNKKIWLSSEYAKGTKGSGNSVIDGNGFNITAGYHLNPKWELVSRYDRFNADAAGAAIELTLGLNYYIKSHDARIQVNLVDHNGPLGSGQGYKHDWTELRTGFQVGF